MRACRGATATTARVRRRDTKERRAGESNVGEGGKRGGKRRAHEFPVR